MVEASRYRETEGFLKLVRQHWERTGQVPLEQIEVGLKAALMRDGCGMLSALLSELSVDADESRHGEECFGKRDCTVETVLGSIELKRNYYYDRRMQKGRIPLDEALGLIHGYSPGLARLMCWAGAQSASYPAASQALHRYGGMDVEFRQIQRLVSEQGPKLADLLDRPWQPEQGLPASTTYISMDATGVPMKSKELQGRRGKQPDGSAKTREAKLGCTRLAEAYGVARVFTQHHVDEQGRPWRDLDSTTYAGGFDTAADFGHRIHREAIRRNVFAAQKLIAIGDGAPWIWEQVGKFFPQAVQILDFYHASEHLKLLADPRYAARRRDEALWRSRKGFGEARALEPSDPKTVRALLEHWQECLRHDGLDQVIAETIARLPRQGPRKKEADKHLAYFENNRHRMQYGAFQKRGWFIGSGVIEAGCKTVIGQRLKQSGMLWSISGAQNILALRCATSSRRFDHAWDLLHPQLALAA